MAEARPARLCPSLACIPEVFVSDSVGVDPTIRINCLRAPMRGRS